MSSTAGTHLLVANCVECGTPTQDPNLKNSAVSFNLNLSTKKHVIEYALETLT